MNQSANEQCYYVSSRQERCVSVYECLRVLEVWLEYQTSQYYLSPSLTQLYLEFSRRKLLKFVSLKLSSVKLNWNLLHDFSYDTYKSWNIILLFINIYHQLRQVHLEYHHQTSDLPALCDILLKNLTAANILLFTIINTSPWQLL